MNILLNVEGYTQGIILIIGEIILAVLIFVLAGVIVRLLYGRLTSISFLQKYLDRSEVIRKRITWLLVILCILSCIAILGYNGWLLYRRIDVYQHTVSMLDKIPPGFWQQLLLRVAKVIGFVIIAHYVIRTMLRLLMKLQERSKAFERLKSNDESIEKFFSRLCRLTKYSLWLLVLLYAGHTLYLPPAIIGYLFILFKIYLIISIGMLIVEAATAVVDSFEALSRKYWYRESYEDWYNRLSGLMPLFRRCLEYIIYVWAASLVMLQLSFISQFASYGPALVQIIGIFFIARMVVEIVNLLVDKFMFKADDISESQRQQSQTLIPITKSILQYGIYFIAFVFILRVLNINPLPLLAGAGILGIVVGLGAQSLINDIVAGFFILFESLFLVGDYIETGTARGIVEAIHIRTSRIRDPDGQLHILRNGQINALTNYSKEYTFAVVEVGVAYDSDLDHVFHVLGETGQQLKENNTDVLDQMNVKGLKEFGESELLIRTVTKVRPGCHFQVAFELRTMIKKAFDREGIEIPFARRVVILKKDNEKEI